MTDVDRALLRARRADSAWRAPLALLALFTVLATLAPVPLEAQLGGALGVRVITRASESVRDSERRGYEGRVYFDRSISSRFGFRGELAYTQMQYLRAADTVRFQVAENGFELLAQATSSMQHGTFTGAFVSAGPVASFRAACGSLGRFDPNGRPACGPGDTFLIGYALGAGYRWPTSRANDFTLELRYLGNITAAAGGQLISISFGVRRR